MEQGGSISRRAVVGVKHDKSTHLAAVKKIVILQTSWLHGEVKTGNEKHKQLDPAG